MESDFGIFNLRIYFTSITCLFLEQHSQNLYKVTIYVSLFIYVICKNDDPVAKDKNTNTFITWQLFYKQPSLTH